MVAEYTISVKKGLQLNDQENGIIICNSVFKFDYCPNLNFGAYIGIVKFLVKIEIKDGRYRTTATNFIHSSNSASLRLITNREKLSNRGMDKPWRNKPWSVLQKKCEAISEAVFLSLNLTTAQSATEDW